MSRVPVSVVVPCFRATGTVERAAASVAAQTARPLELILVDDGSADGTAALLRRIAERLGADWVKVIELPANRGPSAARNAGWDAARGELVAFLDADDSWHAEKLALQVGFMREHPEIALSGHMHSIGPHGGAIERPLRWREVGRRELLLRNPIIVPSVLLRRELPLRFREGQHHMEDHLLFAQLAFRGQRLALLEAPLAALYKQKMGVSGLSGDLLGMEAGELANYRTLRREGAIGAATLALLYGWSLAKFARRLAIVALRRLAGR